MCMAPPPTAPAAPVAPESVKRVAPDQRRTVAANTAENTAAAPNASSGLASATPATQKKSLLGA